MDLEKKARHIVKELVADGFIAYYAGGSVRDLLIRDKSPEDYDIATNATPDQIQALFDRTLEVGKQFGVIIVLIGDDQFEVATFRTESDYQDGRHPGEVSFSTPEEDAKRRDFTINGMFYNPLNDELIDYVGGQRDLKAKIIRAIGGPYERFAEDKLRILRAVRFYVQLGFEIEPATFDAIKDFADKINDVSMERIRDEFTKGLTSKAPDKFVQVCSQLGLLNEIIPEVERMRGVEQPEEYHPEGDVYTHTLLALAQLSNPCTTVAYGVLLHDIAKPDTFEIRDRIRFNKHDTSGARLTARILRRMKFANKDIKRISALVKEHMRFIHCQEMRKSTLKRFMRSDYFEELLELHKVDCIASHGDLSNYYFCKEKLKEFQEESLRDALKPAPILNGDDLLKMGLDEGPIIGDILKKVEDEQLEGNLNTREEAVEFVKKLVEDEKINQ